MKPSIFSKDYEKNVKKRKTTIILVAVIIVLFLGCIYLVMRNNIGTRIKEVINGVQVRISANNKNIAKEGASKQNKKTKTKTPVVKKNNKKDQDESKGKEESSDIKISDSITVKAVFDETGGNKKFKMLDGTPGSITYNVNPSGNKIVLCDKTTQSLYTIDINGNVSDITMKQYVSRNGQVYPEDQEIKTNPSYIWVDSPKFIDDNKVAYISQLPWFNDQSKKYIWIIDLTNNSQNYAKLSSGDDGAFSDIKFDNSSNGKLQIEADGKTMQLDGSGVINQ